MLLCEQGRTAGRNNSARERLTGGAGQQWGPVAVAGCGREWERAGQCGEGCWHVGPASTVPGRGLNSVQTDSKILIGLKIDSKPSKLWLAQKVPSLAPKIGNKISLERIWDNEQLFSDMFPQIRNRYWTKIQGSFYELNFNRNSLKILRTLEFDEIWLEISLLHLIARKNKSPAEEDHEFEFLLKMDFELIS
jgi:hypothetical protein